MTREPNRIYFTNNPYPNGHKITRFVWSGRIEEDESMWFDFHLETDKYYAEDDSDNIDEPESDWKAKIVWRNYHSAILSSTHWGGKKKGIKISTGAEKLNFDSLSEKELLADTLPVDENLLYEDLAFDLYLLGHDSCANHSITFKKDGSSYDIEWTGKIALSYGGSYDFEYDFNASVQDAAFEGFHYPKSWSQEKAAEIFTRNLEQFEDYEFVAPDPMDGKRAFKLLKTRK